MLETALDLLGSGGSDAVTVRAVCREARLNPRYFYESFDDVDALLTALYDDVAEALATAVATALAELGGDPAAGATSSPPTSGSGTELGGDPAAGATGSPPTSGLGGGARLGVDLAEVVRVGVDTVFRFVADDPRRARILYTEALGHEALARRRLASTDDFIAAITEPVAGTDVALDVVTASMFTGGMNEILMGWLGGRIDRSLDDLVDEAVALALVVLGAGTRTRRHR